MADQPDRIVAEDVLETPPASPSKRKRLLLILLAVVIVGTIVWTIWYFVAQAGRVSTDNAYVGAETAQIAPLIAAPVAQVRVAGTQMVRKGDVLVVLDDADMRVAVAEAEAALAMAEQRYAQSRATVGAAQGRLSARGADIVQARAQLRNAQATLERTRIELGRRDALIASGAVSGDELTSARTALQSAQAARDLAQAAVSSAEATQAAAGGELRASAAMVQGTTAATAPEIVSARAALQQARLNLRRTVIRAPIDGVVTNKTVQLGQRVPAGMPIMTLVPVASAYVDANFKEDQLAKVRPGQPVVLHSDFYGDEVEFRGRVVGFAGGTGAAFSLIPAQNATGNWIKVVQRLPVRVALDPAQLRDHPLRVGLSMHATIDTRAK